MRVRHELAGLVRGGIERAQGAGVLPGFEIPAVVIERPRDVAYGDYASPVAMQLARVARMAPLKIAEAIVAHLPGVDFVGGATADPPGFINFRLATDWLQRLPDVIVEEGMGYGRFDLGRGKRAMVEFVSANPTGPITIGRTRGGVMGDTLSRALEAAGYGVTREYYYNDAGRQIEMLGESVKVRYEQILGRAAELGEGHYQGEYIYWLAAALAGEHGEGWLDRPARDFAEVAKQAIMLNQKGTLRRLNIAFDVYYNENDLYTSGRVAGALADLRERGYVYEQEGAQWFRSSVLGDEKDRVLVKSSGEPTYRMGDIAYHWHKKERGFDLVVDIFGADHAATAPTVLMGVKALGYDPDFVHVLIHQFVNLVREGKMVRMSTRRGNYVTLDELMDEVGPDAVRYFMLSRSGNSTIEFDLDLAVERSDKNPVYYIQNAHVRCAGIFRRWVEAGYDLDADADADLSLLTHEQELAFLRKALELPEVLELMVRQYEPHHLAFYAYELAAVFHPMYEVSRVLHSEVPEPLRLARLRLYRAAKVLFARVLDLMGMSAPEVM